MDNFLRISEQLSVIDCLTHPMAFFIKGLQKSPLVLAKKRGVPELALSRCICRGASGSASTFHNSLGSLISLPGQALLEARLYSISLWGDQIYHMDRARVREFRSEIRPHPHPLSPSGRGEFRKTAVSPWHFQGVLEMELRVGVVDRLDGFRH